MPYTGFMIIGFSILVLLLIGLKFKKEPEKFYIPNILLYYIASTLKVGSLNIPVGFLVCLFVIIRPSIKNRGVKIAAVTLGLCYFIISVFLPLRFLYKI